MSEEKKAKRVVEGKVKVKKKGFGRKVADSFIDTDDVKDVKSYILFDVLLPGLKNGLYEVVCNGISMLLYGDTRGVSRGRSVITPYRSPVSNYTNYSRISSGRGTRTESALRSVYDYDDILFSTRIEAEEVRSQLLEIIDAYEVVSVGDYYDTVGMKPRQTDYKFGWDDIGDAPIIPRRDGYYIRLPKARPIE